MSRQLFGEAIACSFSKNTFKKSSENLLMICERLWFSSFCMELHIRQDSPIENNCLGTLVLMVLPTQCKLDQNNPPHVAQAPLWPRAREWIVVDVSSEEDFDKRKEGRK